MLKRTIYADFCKEYLSRTGLNSTAERQDASFDPARWQPVGNAGLQNSAPRTRVKPSNGSYS